MLIELRGEAFREAAGVDRAVVFFKAAIIELESERQKWNAEKRMWKIWQSQLQADMSLSTVADSFTRAIADIEDALSIVSQRLEPLLAIQQKSGDVRTKISNLTDRIDAMIVNVRSEALRGDTAIIFSRAYLQQLFDLIHEPSELFRRLPPPDPAFVAQNGRLFSLQAIIFFSVLILIFRYRSNLLENPACRFLGKRPLSLSVFVSIFALSAYYGSSPVSWPAPWRALMFALAGVVTARLIVTIIETVWIKQMINVLFLMMIGFEGMLTLGVPMALMRLYILFVSIAGLIYFGWRAHWAAVSGYSTMLIWTMRLLFLTSTTIAIINIIGFSYIALRAIDGAIRTIFLVLMGWFMHQLIRSIIIAAFEWLPEDRFAFLRRDADNIQKRVLFFSDILIIFIVSSYLLVVWKLYAIPADVMQDFFAFELPLGDEQVTLGLIILAALILYSSFLLSWSLQALLKENVLSRYELDRGDDIGSHGHLIRLAHRIF
jgi:hypothetical protein